MTSDETCLSREGNPVTILSIDPGLTGAGAILDAHRELHQVFDLPVLGEGARRHIDAASLADLIRRHTGLVRDRRIGRRASWSGRPVNVPIPGDSRRHRGAGHPRPPRVAGEVEKGARPQQRRRNVTCSRDRDLGRPCRSVRPQARPQSPRGRLARALRAGGRRSVSAEPVSISSVKTSG